ncbi:MULTISPECIES: ADP-ribosylglycohydrolase family protein [Brevibacillus]|uniref:ADP-ribosylglycohydrolase family protein n=1 Tax=Brevibacillus TaxID=55080 RepID=UPI002476D5C6|nr:MULTISPECIES: ADP-ribosylglycohydrolase family protein [Brevibacillus]MDH6348128.1 ADP-ribosyl-[dinitrogen reductase] hydrolase [Brevibacillus sp. 1238]MDR5000253.1 ADP-ribosylglycohydrolase family protein [Brevibacillus parabrevis]
MELRERYAGSLLGLAIGDALGATLEFRKPGTFEPLTEMIGGGPFDLQPGQWTDDTSMALCLAESLSETGRFDPEDQMNRYLAWYRKGYMSCKDHCFDIGNATKEALWRYEQTGQPYSGSTDPRTAGNGSIMRLAPVALFFAGEPRQAIDMCAQSSRTTHAAAQAVDGCRFLGALLLGALQGVPKEQLLAGAYSPVENLWAEEPLDPGIARVALGSYKGKAETEIKGSGYVVESLEAALWAFCTTDTFEAGLFRAVNLGDDADTTGAVYGQLAGAYYGVEALPKRMRDLLAKRELIEQMADKLLDRRAN